MKLSFSLITSAATFSFGTLYSAFRTLRLRPASARQYRRAMRCIVSAGPTHESLDQVRRLTNFSTGRLGCELANFLTSRGHHVALLIGQQATWGGERKAQTVRVFGSTANLGEQFEELARTGTEAVFHAAAVSDYTFGKIWLRGQDGQLSEIKAGKISTRDGTLMAELIPTPKLIGRLRGWFPKARLVGWKYEVEGGRESVLRLAERQIQECSTDACVANGAAYGLGFGLVQLSGCAHFKDATALFEGLEGLLR